MVAAALGRTREDLLDYLSEHQVGYTFARDELVPNPEAEIIKVSLRLDIYQQQVQRRRRRGGSWLVLRTSSAEREDALMGTWRLLRVLSRPWLRQRHIHTELSQSRRTRSGAFVLFAPRSLLCSGAAFQGYVVAEIFWMGSRHALSLETLRTPILPAEIHR